MADCLLLIPNLTGGPVFLFDDSVGAPREAAGPARPPPPPPGALRRLCGCLVRLCRVPRARQCGLRTCREVTVLSVSFPIQDNYSQKLWAYDVATFDIRPELPEEWPAELRCTILRSAHSALAHVSGEQTRSARNAWVVKPVELWC